jgi:hypothetical protein
LRRHPGNDVRRKKPLVMPIVERLAWRTILERQRALRSKNSETRVLPSDFPKRGNRPKNISLVVRGSS